LETYPTPITPTKNMSAQFRYIAENWTDNYIEILLYQSTEFRYIAENITKLKETKNKKNIPIFNHLMLYFTKPFNDYIYNTYGIDYLLEGIKNLIQFGCQSVIFPVNELIIKRGYFNEKNRTEILNANVAITT
jgi:hypothetical protein